MAAVWYYLKNGQRLGPVTAGELKTLATSGDLLPDDQVWKEGMAGWEPARSVKGLFEAVRPGDPQLPFPPPLLSPPGAALETTPGPRSSRVLQAPKTTPGVSWLSVLTLLLALGALVFSLLAFFRSPSSLGRGLRAYDLSTPESATQAIWQIEANRDLAAREDLDDLHDDPATVLRTLKIQETLHAPVKNMKIVLFSYQRNGKEKHDYWGFVKHHTKEMWMKVWVSDFELEPAHPDVARRLRDWRSREFDPVARE
jgi:hypothetical protein